MWEAPANIWRRGASGRTQQTGRHSRRSRSTGREQTQAHAADYTKQAHMRDQLDMELILPRTRITSRPRKQEKDSPAVSEKRNAAVPNLALAGKPPPNQRFRVAHRHGSTGGSPLTKMKPLGSTLRHGCVGRFCSSSVSCSGNDISVWG